MLLEQLAVEMMRRADAARPVAELARIRLRIRDQLGHAVDRQRRIHQQDERQVRDHRDRREVLHRVVAELLVERRIDAHRRARRHQQRVAIGRRLDDRVDADLLARAGTVLDHEGLAELLFEHLRAHPRQDVGGARRRERHDDRGASRRIVVGRGRMTARQERDGNRTGTSSQRGVIAHLPMNGFRVQHAPMARPGARQMAAAQGAAAECACDSPAITGRAGRLRRRSARPRPVHRQGPAVVQRERADREDAANPAAAAAATGIPIVSSPTNATAPASAAVT